MTVSWNNDILAVLRRAGLLGLDAPPDMEPLTGGVSSDIWRVEVQRRNWCVKRALPQLKVKANWQAPVERSRFEAGYMEVVGARVPGSVPRLHSVDPVAGAIVMAYMDPKQNRLWKSMLRDGEVRRADAEAVARVLVTIHAATAHDAALKERFASDTIFHAIRIEPYLLATAEAHGDLARPIKRIARQTSGTKLALVHGDVSPKNILLGPDGPVLLDAECAWYGDPAFDLAFCLNHLLLKCLWVPDSAAALLRAFDAFLATYMAGVVWEPRAALEARAAALLPILFLARVDGKSPVEYLTDGVDKGRVRKVARRFIGEGGTTIMPLRKAWGEEIGA